MKRACVVLFGIGILLILWGAGDLVCWGTTGKELLERYPDSGAVAELVEHTFIGGWIKAARAWPGRCGRPLVWNQIKWEEPPDFRRLPWFVRRNAGFQMFRTRMSDRKVR